MNKDQIKLDNMRYFGLHREPLYEGEMVNGKPHGHGKLTFEKFDDKYESSFEGYFDDGIPVEGKFNDRFGTIYDGKFEKEDSEISNGRIIYKDGREYVGEWDGLEKWGQGTMVFSNGVEFKGRWHEDCPSDGVMTYPDGTKFKGWFNQLSYEFANGVIHYPDGSKFESEFADVWSANYSEKKDVFEGTFTYPNGKIVEGTLHIALDWDLPISPSKKDRFEPKETIEMKIKSKLLDTFEKSFKRLYQIRSLIRDDKMDELSDEIHEFYEQNETIIKKWKAVIDFDSKTNPFPIEKKELFAVPVFNDVPDELESIWRCSVNTDIDQRNSGDFYYLDILFYYQPHSSNSFSLIEAEIIDWSYDFQNPEKRFYGGEDETGFVFSNTLSFNKGDNKKDLLAFAKLLFAFVYLGGELGLLRKIKKFEDKE